jgi:hypothetical protein
VPSLEMSHYQQVSSTSCLSKPLLFCSCGLTWVLRMKYIFYVKQMAHHIVVIDDWVIKIVVNLSWTDHWWAWKSLLISVTLRHRNTRCISHSMGLNKGRTKKRSKTSLIEPCSYKVFSDLVHFLLSTIFFSIEYPFEEIILEVLDEFLVFWNT